MVKMMKRCKSEETHSNETIRYNELISKSGGKLATSVARLKLLEAHVDDQAYQQKSPRSSLTIKSPRVMQEGWFQRLRKKNKSKRK